MLCCKSVPSSEIDLIETMDPCPSHGEPVMFVCLDGDICEFDQLLCMNCVRDHKGH